jgi:hypothetical protein
MRDEDLPRKTLLKKQSLQHTDRECLAVYPVFGPERMLPLLK